jgi:hypothetical protein
MSNRKCVQPAQEIAIAWRDLHSRAVIRLELSPPRAKPGSPARMPGHVTGDGPGRPDESHRPLAGSDRLRSDAPYGGNVTPADVMAESGGQAAAAPVAPARISFAETWPREASVGLAQVHAQGGSAFQIARSSPADSGATTARGW